MFSMLSNSQRLSENAPFFSIHQESIPVHFPCPLQFGFFAIPEKTEENENETKHISVF